MEILVFGLLLFYTGCLCFSLLFHVSLSVGELLEHLHFPTVCPMRSYLYLFRTTTQ